MTRTHAHPARLRAPLAVLLLTLGVLLAAALGGCGVAVEPRLDPIPIQKGAVGKVMPAVVDVRVTSRPQSGFIRIGLGTGVIMDRHGLIVTADHVVTLESTARPDSIEVVLADGRRAPAELIGEVPEWDLAFLRTRLTGLSPARFSTQSAAVAQGAHVFAIGAPHHFSRPVARGRVAGVIHGLMVENSVAPHTLIQSDARLREGFSGGPLADAHGRVIGIDLAIARDSLSSRRSSLSVPASVVLEAARQFQRQASPAP